MVHRDPRMQILRGLPQHIREQISVDPRPGACWLWTGSTSHLGYPRAWDGQRLAPVGQLVLEATVGPPPEPGMQVSHKCHDLAGLSCRPLKAWGCPHRLCVTPDPEHMRWEHGRENTLASPWTQASKKVAAAAARGGPGTALRLPPGWQGPVDPAEDAITAMYREMTFTEPPMPAAEEQLAESFR